MNRADARVNSEFMRRDLLTTSLEKIGRSGALRGECRNRFNLSGVGQRDAETGGENLAKVFDAIQDAPLDSAVEMTSGEFVIEKSVTATRAGSRGDNVAHE